MDFFSTKQMLRHLVSVNADRLVIRTSLTQAYSEECPGKVWVARSGDDPRSWFRDDLTNNHTPWQHGRFPFDACFVSQTRLQSLKDAILRRLIAHHNWTHTRLAEVAQAQRRLEPEDQLRINAATKYMTFIHLA